MVLTVSSVMFLSIVGVINGRQQKTQFQSAVNEVRTQVQQIANEVSTGYFPDNNSYTCQSVAASSIKLVPKNTTNNGACVYLGKAIHFYSGAGAKDDQFAVYTIIGRRDEVATYQTLAPHVVSPLPTTDGFNDNNFDITDTRALQYGLTAKWLKYTNSAGAVVKAGGSFAFMQSLNASGKTVSGGASQHLELVAFNGAGSKLSNDQANEALAINNDFKDNKIVIDSAISVCFDSGTTKQSVIVSVDTASSRVGATTKINNGYCS